MRLMIELLRGLGKSTRFLHQTIFCPKNYALYLCRNLHVEAVLACAPTRVADMLAMRTHAPCVIATCDGTQEMSEGMMDVIG